MPYASSLSWSRHIIGAQQIWSNLRMSRKVNQQEKRDQGISWDKVLCKHSGVAREPGAFWGWTKDRVWAAKRLKMMPVTQDNQFTFCSDKTKQDARSPAFPHKSLERIKSSPRPSSPWIPTVCQAPKVSRGCASRVWLLWRAEAARLPPPWQPAALLLFPLRAEAGGWRESALLLPDPDKAIITFHSDEETRLATVLLGGEKC